MAILHGEQPKTPRPDFPRPTRSPRCASCRHPQKWHDTDWGCRENWDPCAVAACMCEHFVARTARPVPCVIVQTDAQNFRCDTHRVAVDQDDVRTPSRCALGHEA
jgi:hypothetical protein